MAPTSFPSARPSPLLANVIEQIPAEAMLIVGVILITAFLFMRMRKRSRQGPGHPTAREQVERYRQQDGVKQDLEGLMVEIEQLARRLGAQLDAKAVHLEKLIADADLRLAQLKKADQDRHAGLAPRDDVGEASLGVGGRNAPGGGSNCADTSATPEEKLPGAGGELPGVRADVYRLADQGLAATAIASRLNEHVGKVELILALRQG